MKYFKNSTNACLDIQVQLPRRRRLQTNTYPHLHRLHRMYPHRYINKCPWCDATPTLEHITYQCTQRPEAAISPLCNNDSLNWSWEARLAELEMGSQLATLDQARRAAVASGALEEGHHPP